MSNLHHTISIIIKGRVQGVWFRASAKKEADKLGIIGFVKNMPDGGVYVEATGSTPELDALTAWCSIGPDLARVDHVEVHQIGQTHLDGFEVRRKT